MKEENRALPDPTGTVFLPVHGKLGSKKLSNVRAVPCRKLEGCQTSSIRNSLKCNAESGIIHRNNRVVFKNLSVKGAPGRALTGSI
ncbi:MAG: hypothetical protein BWY31_02305 [Lentisphaerae bacterium ADurb.Bin242]|nr:MAG: hypothetical protein BWY31_02305 [Lentisphaerae bacterium ADurb.Bin242]